MRRRATLVLVEGRDAAGKTGAIRRLVKGQSAEQALRLARRVAPTAIDAAAGAHHDDG